MNNNKPLYFYHLVNKDADISMGLLSLQYMYDNKMMDLFDKYIIKYKQRIIKDWDIEKFKNHANLTREEYLEGLQYFRGVNGGRYIYFFRFPPYKELGSNMDNILTYKDIYRIDINDMRVKNNIESIFWGFNLSNSDNKELNRDYYENVKEEEYFAKYDDNSKMNFAHLNHIGIVFKDNRCPIELLEKINKGD